jgi:dTDP-4-amino-4,6-dideoxygalactose transaminase
MLERIDEAHWYSNGGPLLNELAARLAGFWRKAGVAVAESQISLVSSGTAALELALQAHGIGPGDRILVPSLTFPATATSVLRCGAEVILGDVDAKSWQLTPACAERARREHQLSAVVPVGPWGTAVPTGEWTAFAAATGVPVVVDSAAGFGVQHPVSGLTIVYSMHATKPYAAGEGGLVVGTEELIDEIRRLANFGFERRQITRAGTNAKLSEYHAAVALAALDAWPQAYAGRMKLRDEYESHTDLFNAGDNTLLNSREWFSVDSQPLVARSGAALLRDKLLGRGVESRQGYCPPLHWHPAFGDCLRVDESGGQKLLNSELLFERVLLLPMHLGLSGEDVFRVASAVAECEELAG